MSWFSKLNARVSTYVRQTVPATLSADTMTRLALQKAHPVVHSLRVRYTTNLYAY